MKLLTLRRGKVVRWLVGKNAGQPRPRPLEQLVRTMKLTCVLLTVAFLHVSAGSFSQQVTLSLKDVPIEKVFREIERQTGYGFLYNKKMFEDFPKVTIEAKNEDIKGVLDQCFRSMPIDYVIDSQTIVIRKKTQLETEPQSPAEALPGDIHGHVTDTLGHPLMGASVTIKGQKHGTQTDEKGNFTLKGVASNATLVVSYLGFESQTVKVTGGNEIRIQLKQSMSKLDETVVKGYYNTTERLNTGDVTTVTGEMINEQPVSDPILALEGRVPGLNIQQASGIPGAYGTIRIQGVNSIANGSSPLYIVDGVPYTSISPTSAIIGGGALGTPFGTPTPYDNIGESPFNNLNPNEIESIVVLKDADATAIYGSRGANGVILITTKKGKAGHTQFDINCFTGTGKVTRMLSLMNTPEYLAMRHEALNNDGLTPGASDFDLNGIWDTTRYTNWQKVLIGNAAQFNNIQGNLSGGNANTQFLLGAGYSNQGTVYPGSYSDQKASVNLNLSHISTDQRLHMVFTTSYVNDNSILPRADFAGYTNLAPDAPALYTTNGNLNWQPLNGRATWGNPLGPTLDKAKASTDNLIGDLNLSYLILPGLQVKSNFGYSHAETNQYILTPASSFAPPLNNNSSDRSDNFGTNDFTTWIIEPQVSYEKRIAQGTLNALVGSTIQQNAMNEIANVATGFSSDALIQDPLAATSDRLVGVINTLYHYVALFGRISYNWQDKYLVNLTARRDGSSRFGPGKQFGNFGAVGAAWIFSKEDFLKNALPFLSFGKLRGSYGITGNDQIADYQYLSTYTPYYSTYENTAPLYPTSLFNPNFAWEVVKKLELGLDLGVLKNRILFSVTYFRNRTGNQLVGYTLPSLSGFSSVQANLPAVVQNSGTEFTLNTINIKALHFTWSSSVNLTIPTNKLISYPNLSSSGYANVYAVGKSLFIEKVFAVAGVNDTTGEYQYSSKGGPTYNPNYPNDLVITKPITQNWYGGIQNTFAYKGFQLDVFFQYVNQTGVNYWGSTAYPEAGEFNLNYPTAILSRWQKPGDVSKYGRFSTEYASDPSGVLYGLSNFPITDASFLRLKNLSLSYQLPKYWLNRVHLETVRVYLQCQNLFTFTHYFGLDPETGGTNLPPIRMVTGGIQVKL